MKERYRFLDITRGLAIVLMVLGHCDSSNKINYFLGLFNMSVFIFISGYLFKDKTFENIKDLFKYILRKVKKLYLFYLKYEVIFYLLRPLFIKLNLYSTAIEYGGKIVQAPSSIIEAIKELLKIVIGMGREPFCGAFWYFISLIFVIIGYSIIHFICNKQRIINRSILKKILIIISFLIGFIMQKYINIPRIAPALTLLLIFDLGNECYKNKKIKFDKYFLIPISFIALLFLNNYGRISVNSNYYTNPIFFIVCSIIGIYMMVSLGKLLEKIPYINSIFEYTGKHTMYIMAYHFICFKLAMLIQLLITKDSLSNIAILNGYKNFNAWIILYVLFGVATPLLIEKSKDIILNKLKKQGE